MKKLLILSTLASLGILLLGSSSKAEPAPKPPSGGGSPPTKLGETESRTVVVSGSTYQVTTTPLEGGEKITVVEAVVGGETLAHLTFSLYKFTGSWVKPNSQAAEDAHAKLYSDVTQSPAAFGLTAAAALSSPGG